MAKHTNKCLGKDTKQARQGDVFVEVFNGKIPEGARILSLDERSRIILAEGEVTGHHHAITVPDLTTCEAYEKDGVIYLHVVGDIDLVHEEHDYFSIAPEQTYRSTIQWAYDPIESNRVRD